MSYRIELRFFQKLMANYNCQMHIFATDNPPEVDSGLRRLLGLTEEYANLKDLLRLKSHTIYSATDSFGCCYNGLLLPDGEQILLIGPYLRQEMSDAVILALLEHHHLPVSLLPSLRQFYGTTTYFENDSFLLTLLNTLGECIWGSKDAFSMEFLEAIDTSLLSISEEQLLTEKMTEAVDIRLIEARYEGERKLMHAVSHGQIHQAQMMISRAHENIIEHRVPDTLRSLRNYGIVLNTLLRKAAEKGGVHPLHIDKLSASIARKLETMRTPAETLQLYNTMVHKYCLLVKNHSMQQYSLLVQHVLLRIETDLTADLSLKAHAEHLNVNASYLSTLFKKETGTTLTEYVNRARIDHAIFLLNASDMQIQSIAQSCGIPDVNYFTKLFKRIVGKTPKEYRQDTRRMITEK